jgi:ABC-2 type transport system permease protein
VSRSDPLLPNTLIIARREYLDRIRSRMFHASTVFLAALAVLMAFLPLFARAFERGTTTRVAVVASDDALAGRVSSTMGLVLNSRKAGGGPDPYTFTRAADEPTARNEVSEGKADAALLATRTPTGQLVFSFLTGEGIGADRATDIALGTFAVGVLDYTAANPGAGSFQPPTLGVQSIAGPSAGGSPLGGSEFASRRILGIVFVVLIFIVLVIYGMWVATGVVAEKTSRVMELIISAASARQLVIGKVLGIGAAGVTQYSAVLVPALIALGLEDRIATSLFGEGESVTLSLAGLAPPLLLAYGVFFILGFTLYALIYAAAGSLVSRPEDLQGIALPLSLLAIGGYIQAVLALSGGTAGFIRFASYVPFWSPFVMMTRLTVGRVEPGELVLSYGLLIVTIGVTVVIATRVYAAGVLLYGQRAGLRQVIEAVRHPA